MSAHSIKDLIRLWETENITQEQAIGQILLLQGLQQQIYELERRVARGEGRGAEHGSPGEVCS